MDDVPIRVATLDDAYAIAVVHVKTWQSAYRGMIPDEYLASRSVEQRLTMWQRGLVEQVPPQRTFVAEVEGGVTGFCTVGACRDQDAGKATGEVYAIYLDAQFMDRGIGSKLIEVGQVYLIEQGFARATLWVLEANQRARRFYEWKGWTADGVTREVDFANVTIPEMR